jgi:SAM-dependent methyltransferase
VVEADFERRAHSFGPAAKLYDRARPSYPREAIRWMLGEAPLHVVDLGAGTGIFSRAVAGLGHDVTAVDHDGEMLEQLAATTVGIRPLEGTAEAIPLPDASADAVVAAQAFHWFDNDDARSEIARVLRPGGVFAPIWNIRDESVEWVATLSTIIPASAGASASVHVRSGRGFGPLFSQPERAEFRHTVRHTSDSLVRLVQSRSMYLVAGDVERSQIERHVRELVESLPQPFELPYLTVAFRAYAVATG